MQEKNDKTLHLANKLGIIIEQLRIKAGYKSRKLFADEYGLDDGNLYRIEKGQIEIKFVTLLKIIQALNMNFLDFAKLLEDELGEDFTLIDK